MSEEMSATEKYMIEKAALPKKRIGRPPKVDPEQVKAEAKLAADRAEERARKGAVWAKMKARPNWESEDFVGVGLDHVDRLHIPREIVDALHADGVALQWVTRSIRGQEMPQELSKMTRGGWTPVSGTDFDGILDGMFTSKGSDDVIGVEDCLLVARPAEIHAKAKMVERRAARAPVSIVEQQMGRGLPVAGGDHPQARAGNRNRSSWERIEIPE